MNQIKLIEKSKLSDDQLFAINQRLKDPVHKYDAGPPEVWNRYQNYMFAVVRKDDDAIIGLVEASGRPVACPGWWIDSEYRNQGYGYQVMDTLAEYLVRDGVKKIGPIPMQGNSQEHSKKLVKRLRESFLR